MVDSLLAQYRVIGMDQQQLLKMLGDPLTKDGMTSGEIGEALCRSSDANVYDRSV